MYCSLAQNGASKKKSVMPQIMYIFHYQSQMCPKKLSKKSIEFVSLYNLYSIHLAQPLSILHFLLNSVRNEALEHCQAQRRGLLLFYASLLYSMILYSMLLHATLLYATLRSSTALHRHTSMPLHFYVSTPLCLYTSIPALSQNLVVSPPKQ